MLQVTMGLHPIKSGSASPAEINPYFHTPDEARFEHILVVPTVLLCSLAVLDPRVGHTMDFLHLSF